MENLPYIEELPASTWATKADLQQENKTLRARVAELDKLAKDAERYLKAITAYADGVKLKQSRIQDESFDWSNLEAVDYIDHEEIKAGLELEKIAALASVHRGKIT